MLNRLSMSVLVYQRCMTADISTITSIANDAHLIIFAKQIRALGQKGLLFAISTSGNSGNICAIKAHMIDKDCRCTD